MPSAHGTNGTKKSTQELFQILRKNHLGTVSPIQVKKLVYTTAVFSFEIHQSHEQRMRINHEQPLDELLVTSPETDIVPEIWWLEGCFPFKKAYLQVQAVGFRKGSFRFCSSNGSTRGPFLEFNLECQGYRVLHIYNIIQPYQSCCWIAVHLLLAIAPFIVGRPSMPFHCIAQTTIFTKDTYAPWRWKEGPKNLSIQQSDGSSRTLAEVANDGSIDSYSSRHTTAWCIASH